MLEHFFRYLIFAALTAAMKCYFDIPLAVAVGIFALMGGGTHLALHLMGKPPGNFPTKTG